MKKFKYKLAIKNYDQNLIDWCVRVGYRCKMNSYEGILCLVSNWVGCNQNIGFSVSFDKRFQDYLIDYKNNPDLTKALLAAVKGEEYNIGELFEYGSVYTVSSIYPYSDNSGIGLCYNKNGRNEIVCCYDAEKLNLKQLLNHFNCKLSGKEIVSESKKIEPHKNHPNHNVKYNSNGRYTITKMSKIDRLRTELDRIKSKYYGMLGFPFNHGVSEMSSKEWNLKLRRLYDNMTNIERKLHKADPTKLPPGLGKNAFKDIDKFNLPDACGLFDTKDQIELIDPGLTYIDATSLNADNLRKLQDIVNKEISKKEPKPIWFKCKNKDCSCEKLYPDIYNDPKKAKCRNYEEKENWIPLGFIEDYQVFINKDSCKFYGYKTQISFDKITDMVNLYNKTDLYTKRYIYFDNGDIKMGFPALKKIHSEMLKLRK